MRLSIFADLTVPAMSFASFFDQRWIKVKGRSAGLRPFAPVIKYPLYKGFLERARLRRFILTALSRLKQGFDSPRERQQTHNLKVTGSNPVPATRLTPLSQ